MDIGKTYHFFSYNFLANTKIENILGHLKGEKRSQKNNFGTCKSDSKKKQTEKYKNT